MAKVDEEGAALAGDLLQPLMKGFDALIGRRLVIILPIIAWRGDAIEKGPSRPSR
jgi:hypothetical protein